MTDHKKPDASLLDGLQGRLIAAVEIGVNRVLGYDENALAGCAELEGRIITIELVDLGVPVFCHPGAWGLRLGREAPPRDADARISGRSMALLELALADDKAAASMREKVRFDGDVAVAQKLQKIVTKLDIDWEEILAEYTGDVLAVQLHRGARRVGDQLRRNLESLLMTGSEYLREEARLSPTQPEFEEFAAEVTRLKHDVARSEARLQALQERIDED